MLVIAFASFIIEAKHTTLICDVGQAVQRDGFEAPTNGLTAGSTRSIITLVASAGSGRLDIGLCLIQRREDASNIFKKYLSGPGQVSATGSALEELYA
jgi:hypothetical protein